MPELVGRRSKDVAAEETSDGEKLEETHQGEKTDLLVKAKTGTGKTIAFLVPAIEARLGQIEREARKSRINPGSRADDNEAGRNRREITKKYAGTLIISPTRELATQIANESIKLGSWHKLLETRLFVGGESRMGQIKAFKRGRCDTIVATPGRLRDLMDDPESGVGEALKHTETLVLDEADTLLEMGFAAELRHILAGLPKERQTFFFSATVSPQIRKIAQESLKPDHLVIDCVPENESNTHAHIPQYGTVLPSAADQIPHVLRLLAHDQLLNPTNSKIILFLPTTKMTQLYATLIRELKKTLPHGKDGRDIDVIEMHSKKDQRARSRGADMFRKSRAKAAILVTSDVSARGVDYPGVTRVIQVGIPSAPEQYVHRVGRTGRAGKTGGRGDLVLLPWEAQYLRQLDEIPLKATTVETLVDEVQEMAKEYDADPEAYVKRKGGDVSTLTRSRNTRNSYNKEPVDLTYSPTLAKLDSTVQELLPNLDPEAINDVFMSMVGYYTTHSEELQASKMSILGNLKTWSTEAAGLEEPPYVSPNFLAKLGIRADRPQSQRRPSFGGSFGSKGGFQRGGSSSGGGFDRSNSGGPDSRFRSKGATDGGNSWNDRSGGAGRSSSWNDRSSSGGGDRGGYGGGGFKKPFGGNDRGSGGDGGFRGRY